MTPSEREAIQRKIQKVFDDTALPEKAMEKSLVLQGLFRNLVQQCSRSSEHAEEEPRFDSIAGYQM